MLNTLKIFTSFKGKQYQNDVLYVINRKTDDLFCINCIKTLFVKHKKIKSSKMELFFTNN